MEGDVKYAGFWIRAAALLLDIAVLYVVSLILQMFAPGKMMTPPDLTEVLQGMESLPEFFKYLGEAYKPTIVSSLIYLPAFFLIAILYMVIMTWRFGATLGKMALGIKVVKDDLQPITFGGALIREFLIRDLLIHIVLAPIFWLGYLWASWDKKKQGWHDKIAHTVVIKERGVKPPAQAEAPPAQVKTPPADMPPPSKETLPVQEQTSPSETLPEQDGPPSTPSKPAPPVQEKEPFSVTPSVQEKAPSGEAPSAQGSAPPATANEKPPVAEKPSSEVPPAQGEPPVQSEPQSPEKSQNQLGAPFGEISPKKE